MLSAGEMIKEELLVSHPKKKDFSKNQNTKNGLIN